MKCIWEMHIPFNYNFTFMQNNDAETLQKIVKYLQKLLNYIYVYKLIILIGQEIFTSD